MSSSEFKFIAIEIPMIITSDALKRFKENASKITIQDAEIINIALDLDVSEVQMDDISEEDLFHIGKESLKAKKAVHYFLNEAIDTILLPRVNVENRLGTEIHDKSFVYLELEDKLYVASGDMVSYYGSKSNKSYAYLLALNISGILKS
jgi:hypothetical protein